MFFLNFCTFSRKNRVFDARFPAGTGIFVWLTNKNIRYARKTCSRWLPMGPIRQSLSHERTGRTPRPRRIRGRVQGKAHAIQKEIVNYRKSRFIPYLCRVFLPSYRPFGIRRHARFRFGRPGVVFYRLLCGFRARIWAANFGRFLHI